MRRLLGSWWVWLLVPGGSIIGILLWLHARGKKAQASQAAARQASIDFNSDPLAAAQQKAQNALNYVMAEANALRGGGLGGDPLAQALLGVPASALNAPVSSGADASATAAANRTKAKALLDDIAAAQVELAQDQAGYAANHNGGQSAEEEQGIEAGVAGRIAADNAALNALNNA